LLELMAGMTITRDGAPVLSEFQLMITGNFSDVLTLISRKPDTPSADVSGTYEVTMTLPSGFKSSLEYRLGVFAEDRNVETRRTLTPAVPAVGHTVDVAVQLNYLNLGIAGANVVVRAFAPGADMGELLSQGNPVPLSSSTDATNAGIQKYDQLAANDPAFLAQLALSPNAIAMTDAGGGLYTGSLTVPDTVGVIQLVYDVAADSPVFGKIQRHWTESVYAGFNEVDLANSGLSWRRDEAGLILTFTPLRPPSGKKDGTYDITLTTSDPKAPISVGLFGNEIYNGPAGWGKGPPRSVIEMALSWPWWLLILILLLLLLLLIWRRRFAGP